MAVPAHGRLTYSGTFGPSSTPYESWQINVNTDQILYTNAAERDAAMPGFSNAWAVNMVPIFGSGIRLKNVRFAAVDGLGKVQKTLSGAYEQSDLAVDVPGTYSGPATHPLQVAAVVTLLTGRAGATGKGRLFLPSPGYAVGADYRWTDSNADALAGNTGLFIKAINTQLQLKDPSARVVVASSKGYLSDVTSVKAGRVPDTMRSRRGDLLEAYRTYVLT
jgi:hypothetical protein